MSGKGVSVEQTQRDMQRAVESISVTASQAMAQMRRNLRAGDVTARPLGSACTAHDSTHAGGENGS